MIIETFRQAIQNVWSNKLRTFLTMLGIIIGVMAVIVIVGLGNGMTKSMRDSFSAMGTNTLNINVWGYGSRTISVDDVYAIAEKNPELIQSVSPQIDFSGSGDLKIGTSTYRWLSIYGVDEDYTTLKNYTIAKGRGLQYMDIKDNKQVCIIGDYLNRVAFGGNGVGQTLKIGANKFRIVGVLAAKVSDPSLQEGSDDACVYLPYTTVMRLSKTSTNQSYIAIMTDESKANDAKAVMDNVMNIAKEKLASGQIVRINDLGSFRLAISTEGVESADKFTAANIKKARIVFVPCKELKDICKTLSYKKTSTVATKGQGGSEDGGSENPGGGGSDGDQGENPLG